MTSTPASGETPGATVTPPLLPTSTSTPPAGAACVGDCSGDGQVTVDELLTMVAMGLGNTPVVACEVADANHDGQVTINETLTAVNNALSGCPVR